jgi:hypothetical protein
VLSLTGEVTDIAAIGQIRQQIAERSLIGVLALAMCLRAAFKLLKTK